MNGINVFAWDVAYRYIDYDITYVYAPGPFLKYNADNWRHPDGVRQIGAFKMPREDVRDMVRQGKSRDVVCFAKNYCDGPEFFRQLYRLGRALPDRTIHVSLKKTAIRLGGHDEFVAAMDDTPPNVKMTDDGSFDLIRRCAYVLSGESSIVAEAINLGSITFFLDTYPEKEIYIYRDYHDLAHRDGEEIARRIRGIEDGTWIYPVKRYADLADISGWLAFDVIRRDVGLEPLDPPILSRFWNSDPDETPLEARN